MSMGYAGSPCVGILPGAAGLRPAGRRKHESEYGGRNVAEPEPSQHDDRRLRVEGGSMPLTPEDVSNKRFTPVRLREGYDMGEVDQFLDEVEAELARLTRDNEDLRSQLAAGQNGGAPVAAAAPDTTAETTAETTPETATREPEKAAPVAPSETIKVTTVGEASSAAARLLELATRNADELVGEAKNEADMILAEARTKAERLESESKAKADEVEADARTRSEMLESETAERRQQLLGDLEREKVSLNTEVENLRSFEREYRSRLKSYFEQQLEALDGHSENGGQSASESSTGRIKSLLGDDTEHSTRG